MVSVRPLAEVDRHWVIKLMTKEWGSSLILSRGKIHDVKIVSGLIATEDNVRVGVLLFTVENNQCEIISLNSAVRGRGIGSTLIEEVKKLAEKSGCTRIWTITTNDNTSALRYYQKRSFRLVSLYRNEIEKSRKLKPEIPLIGIDGIPLRDEIELEFLLK